LYAQNSIEIKTQNVLPIPPFKWAWKIIIKNVYATMRILSFFGFGTFVDVFACNLFLKNNYKKCLGNYANFEFFWIWHFCRSFCLFFFEAFL
jgi:hypothetical protein